MISLGLAILPSIITYSPEIDYKSMIYEHVLIEILAIVLILPSIIGSFFELNTTKYRPGFSGRIVRKPFGKITSMIYGFFFLILGLIVLLCFSILRLFYMSKWNVYIFTWIICGILGITGALVYRENSRTFSLKEIVKRRKIGFMIGIFYITILLSTFLFYNIAIGYKRETNVLQDAYVYENNSNVNFGDSEQIYVGNYESGKTEAFYYFDVSKLPKGWVEADIIVRFDYASFPVNVGVCFIYESWDEMSITWNNKPNRTLLSGFIVCDGFDFRVPLKPKYFPNNEITICLYGLEGITDGYLVGNSKEALSENDIPYVYLEYQGLDPNFIMLYIMGYLTLFVIAVLYVKFAGRTKSRATTRTPISTLGSQEELLLRRLARIHHIHPPANPPRPIYTDYYKPKKIYKINELVDLRLIGNRTHIYVNNKRLMVCAFLLINIPEDHISDYDEIRSIDEAAEFLDKSLESNSPFRFKITPEEEFIAHCSNIQAFFENGLNTDILHSNIAFPLLKELVHQGFQPALKIFKEEIARRFNEGTLNSRKFLYIQGYLNYLNKEEKQILKGYDNFLNNLHKLYGERDNFRGLFERPLRIFKIVVFGDLGVGKNTFHQRYISSFGLDTRVTIGVNLGIKNVNLDNQFFRLQIWNIDTNHFRNMHQFLFRGAQGGIFIYDITNKTSLNRLDDWLSSINLGFRGRERFPIIIVGNKSDLAQNREVPVDYALKFAKSRGMNSYIECSFLTGKNVEKIFNRLMTIILKHQMDT